MTQYPKQSNIFKIITSFVNLKLQIFRLAQGHWSGVVSKKKIVGLMAKYYLPAGDTSQVSIFFSYIR